MDLMREIYKAARVLVWLGEDVNCKAEQAFDRINRIARLGNDIPFPEDSWWNPIAALYSCE